MRPPWMTRAAGHAPARRCRTSGRWRNWRRQDALPVDLVVGRRGRAQRAQREAGDDADVDSSRPPRPGCATAGGGRRATASGARLGRPRACPGAADAHDAALRQGTGADEARHTVVMPGCEPCPSAWTPPSGVPTLAARTALVVLSDRDRVHHVFTPVGEVRSCRGRPWWRYPRARPRTGRRAHLQDHMDHARISRTNCRKLNRALDVIRAGTGWIAGYADPVQLTFGNLFRAT